MLLYVPRFVSFLEPALTKTPQGSQPPEQQTPAAANPKKDEHEP
jgi:hypothetical protein